VLAQRQNQPPIRCKGGGCKSIFLARCAGRGFRFWNTFRRECIAGGGIFVGGVRSAGASIAARWDVTITIAITTVDDSGTGCWNQLGLLRMLLLLLLLLLLELQLQLTCVLVLPMNSHDRAARDPLFRAWRLLLLLVGAGGRSSDLRTAR
jgi:hypothetical protein